MVPHSTIGNIIMVLNSTNQRYPIKNNRGLSMKLVLPFLMSLFPVALVEQCQSTSPQPPSGALAPQTTEVIVVMTPRQGVTRQQIMKIMPDEIRATVKLYLEGRIRQWYSRGDGRGVVSHPRREDG